MNLDSLTCAAASEYVKYPGNIIYLCNCFDDYYKHRNFLIDHYGLTKKLPCAKSAMMINPQVRQAEISLARVKAVEDARQMQASIVQAAKRVGNEPPNYSLMELIGKGSYGRVYKG